MIIRKAVATDVAELYKLEQELFTDKNFPLSKGSFSYHIGSNLIYLAEIDGNIAGYALTLIKRRDAKIYSIGIRELYRGKKVALNLLKIVHREILSLNFEKTVLEVRIDNERAITLYKNFGFTVKKELKAFYLDGCNAYLMELE
ncbi:MAG: GNAT family N-acetyltransferase [Campylobacterales bacterium]|nr:GNAT family N-acetyltransferase [Campylobacterales bacterium]